MGPSEEAIIVGILRLADEIAMQRPGSVVVIQGLLPRSSFNDGHLESTPLHQQKYYYRPEQYPLWPSIELINEELEKFFQNHEHMIYFDTTALFFASLGDEQFKSSENVILKNLMTDYTHPSLKGYEVLAEAMGKELNRIIYEHDEENHKITANEDKSTR